MNSRHELSLCKIKCIRFVLPEAIFNDVRLVDASFDYDNTIPIRDDNCQKPWDRIQPLGQKPS
jgi:hypothetical protein